METFFELLPMDIIGVIISYIEYGSIAINLITIKPFNVMFSSASHMRFIITNKIGKFFNSLYISFGDNAYANLLLYFECVAAYSDTMSLYKGLLEGAQETKFETYWKIFDNAWMVTSLAMKLTNNDIDKKKIFDNYYNDLCYQMSIGIKLINDRIEYTFNMQTLNSIKIDKDSFLMFLLYDRYER